VDEVLVRLMAEIESFQADIRAQPVSVRVTPREIRAHLSSRYDAFAQPQPLTAVLEDVAHMMRAWTVHSTHPRHFGLFNPSTENASIVGDALAALYNPQLAIWGAAPAAVEIEQFVLNALACRFGYAPESTAATFTSGGAEANLSALVAALTHALPDYAEQGLAGQSARPVFYLSEEGHPSLTKAAHLTGLGRHAVRTVPVDAGLRLDLAALARTVQQDRAQGLRPFLVVGTAGTTGAGMIDPLDALASFCADEGLWFHVDAAWGGAAVLSSRLAPYLTGLARADSITCDAHKWFSMAMGAGMFFCRHPAAVHRAFAAEAPYMPRGTPADRAQPFVSTVQWSRRFTGLKLFMALAEQGFAGFEARIDAQSALADRLRTALRTQGWRVLNDTPLPVVCFSHPWLQSGRVKLRRVLEYLYRNQIAWIAETRVRGRTPVLRACVSSFRTEAADIDALMEGLQAALSANA
jgi:glutamate/tyrosine decarboxylase-like PLP-dependent enzyme